MGNFNFFKDDKDLFDRCIASFVHGSKSQNTTTKYSDIDYLCFYYSNDNIKEFALSSDTKGKDFTLMNLKHLRFHHLLARHVINAIYSDIFIFNERFSFELNLLLTNRDKMILSKPYAFYDKTMNDVERALKEKTIKKSKSKFLYYCYLDLRLLKKIIDNNFLNIGDCIKVQEEELEQVMSLKTLKILDIPIEYQESLNMYEYFMYLKDSNLDILVKYQNLFNMYYYVIDNEYKFKLDDDSDLIQFFEKVIKQILLKVDRKQIVDIYSFQNEDRKVYDIMYAEGDN